MRLEEAKRLRRGEVLHHRDHKNADGTPQRWRVNGKVKTWKLSPERVKVPVKCGLFYFDYLTEDNLHLLERG